MDAYSSFTYIIFFLVVVVFLPGRNYCDVGTTDSPIGFFSCRIVGCSSSFQFLFLYGFLLLSTMFFSSTPLCFLDLHENHYLLTNFLKNKLRFRGILISVWEGIDRITTHAHVNYTFSIQAGVLAGIDILSECQYSDHLNKNRKPRNEFFADEDAIYGDDEEGHDLDSSI
ncbi:hypothetical protein KFK09_026494 [Dendrobium nobile]|uniref:beta-glucosidase n=1 Tax=Dendrobium nobile TaxID=94219 RepID=A0A8T3AD09_DENNO|nr:hypothetical protein KFK09_026494 [Dendrobium nobile]